ncbi:LuxR C-terminal-related transcriptional regulator [Actinomadura madurae]|uniref:LuxR C-terminal-related transcriptional regulator n=1 Tax=Actinomadura madurae TaxID=1993 RepID=UPI0020D1F9C0|nr:LuxR C-terminal-related transcriptional regulator [Actinomadura madurae]MCP9971909.1 LuxR C-terminal-related transcriptional regulator [Actinomadura madurae]MCP9984414.1 LuxR C-terminal-related transcriptional regulator [Actinomadura madurae]MCQ0004035.1 LuxR C-terminal-related transcriptional regulator [Actinomadura madurae]
MSKREAEVLAALAERLSNVQIAGRFHISVRTVESHISSLLRKYGVADRWELAEEARRGTPPPGHIAGLPAARTAFFGRAEEIATVLALLEKERLVTLLGTGGVGKTRLAAVAAEAAAPAFPLGGAFVDLVPVGEALVTQAVASALGVTQRPGRSLDDTIARRLARGRTLLVLDNCEHLLDAAADFVDRLLTACPTVTVLATARERIGVQGSGPSPSARSQWTPTPNGCSWTAPRRPIRDSPPPAPTSPRSAAGWTGCRWRSSSPRRAPRPSGRPDCWRHWTMCCGC